MIKNVYLSSSKVMVTLVRFERILNIHVTFSKNILISIMKISPVGAEFYADGRTDMTKLKVAFRNFANVSKY
jgi:hypothetical protein